LELPFIVSVAEGASVYSGEVRAYPNPARDKVSIEMPERIYDQVRIMDNMGRIVLQNTISSDKVTLNVDKLSKGLYLVELRNEKNKKVYLLSIQ